MRCPQCGGFSADTAAACGECGAALAQKKRPVFEPRPAICDELGCGQYVEVGRYCRRCAAKYREPSYGEAQVEKHLAENPQWLRKPDETPFEHARRLKGLMQKMTRGSPLAPMRRMPRATAQDYDPAHAAQAPATERTVPDEMTLATQLYGREAGLDFAVDDEEEG